MSSDTRERPDSGSIENHDPAEAPVSLVTYVSDIDGATVVEIETGEFTGHLRVYVNEGVIFDQNPEEHGPCGECGAVFRTASGAHRCGVHGPHPGRPHVCRDGVVMG